MTNTTVVPLQNAYKTTLSSSIDGVTTTITVDNPPDFTVPVGKKIPAVIDPKNNFREGVYITAISGNDLTVERGKPDYEGGPSTATTHSAGATVVITNHFAIFEDFSDAIDSKLDNDGGNTTTTFDMQVSASSFRIRKDGADMKFTDDSQGEVTLSTLAAGGGADEKAKVSANDTTAGYLNGKLVQGLNVTLTENNDGGNETLTIAAASANETVVTHATYTPAFLTGGNAPETNVAIWDSVNDGEFRITIDGVVRDITGLDFQTPPVTSMAEVAAVIQTGIRAATGSTETCTWSGTEFVISSVDTTASSAITVTSAVPAGTGTDISGAGSAYMDCDATSTAAVTAAVLDPTADAGKVPALNASGYIDGDLVNGPTLGLTAKGSLVTASDATTKTELAVGADGSTLVADSTAPGGLAWSSTSTNMLHVDTTTYNHLGTTQSNNTIYTVPGGTLGTDGGLLIKVWVSNWIATNLDSTKLAISYGGTEMPFNLTSDGTTQDVRGIAEFQIVGTGATNTQTYMATMFLSESGSGQDYATGTEAYAYGQAYANMTIDSTLDQDIVLIGDGSGAAEGWTVTRIFIQKI